MGGIVSRHAARPREDGRRLRVRRLFTIASPHRGARMATLPTLDRRQIDMRPGSPFLAELDGALEQADYELVTYARLGDAVVGAANSAPHGRDPWWVDCPPLGFAHLGAGHDHRILADIARRLRGEEPLVREPPVPVEEAAKLRGTRPGPDGPPGPGATAGTG
jgi:hypothetical protein